MRRERIILIYLMKKDIRTILCYWYFQGKWTFMSSFFLIYHWHHFYSRIVLKRARWRCISQKNILVISQFLLSSLAILLRFLSNNIELNPFLPSCRVTWNHNRKYRFTLCRTISTNVREVAQCLVFWRWQ